MKGAAVCLVLALGCIAPDAARPADAGFPNKPIRFIVPLPVGSVPDLRARQLGQRMTLTLGQTIVVDNRPGAGSNLGAALAAKAAPDGYTILLGNLGVFAINPALYGKLPFDPVKDFEPICLAFTAPFAVMINPALPARSVGELIALANARPGELTYASLGSGTLAHLGAELFKDVARVDVRHIPYREYAVLTGDLMSGRVDMFFDSLVVMSPHAKSGRVRALAVSGNARLPAFPELPTFAEAGLPAYEMQAWTGVAAPAHTPPAIIARLNAALNEALQQQDVREANLAVGSFALGGTPQEFAARIRADQSRWAKIVARTGAKVE